MAEDAVQLKFRVPADMRAALEAAAAANGRSLSAEIVARLETTITAPTALTHQEMSDAIQEYEVALDDFRERLRSLEEHTGLARIRDG